LRPDPQLFDPSELDPKELSGYRAFVARAFRDDSFGRSEPAPKPSPSGIKPVSWWSPPSPPLQPKLTLFERLLARLASNAFDERASLAAKAELAVLSEAVVWGVWAGLGASDPQGASVAGAAQASRDLGAAAAYAMNPVGVDLAYWGEVLGASDAGALPPPPVQESGLQRDPPIAPSLPGRALLKQLFLPAACRSLYEGQVVRAVPWVSEQGDINTLERTAPALTDVLAAATFGGMAPSLALGSWGGGKREALDVTRAFIRQRVFKENVFEGLDGDKGQWVDRLNEQRVWTRGRPLGPPFSCVDLLHVAIWANVDATSFDDVMAAVRSIGGDADACAAAGAFAGGLFGRARIPVHLIRKIPTDVPVANLARRYAEINVPQ